VDGPARTQAPTGHTARPCGVVNPAEGNRVKVQKSVLTMTAKVARLLVVIPLSMTLSLGALVSPAHAITRPQVIARANHWIKKRVRYSQRSTYQGYRRDCSGFVSMAWKLKHSYTSSSIRSKARRISWRSLKPGDAVRRSGHVEIFAGWKNKKHRRYWALEESTWGKPALRAVKQFKSGYSALRRVGITDGPATRPRTRPRVTPPVVTPKPPVVVTPPSVAPTSSAIPTLTLAPDGLTSLLTSTVATGSVALAL